MWSKRMLLGKLWWIDIHWIYIHHNFRRSIVLMMFLIYINFIFQIFSSLLLIWPMFTLPLGTISALIVWNWVSLQWGQLCSTYLFYLHFCDLIKAVIHVSYISSVSSITRVVLFSSVPITTILLITFHENTLNQCALLVSNNLNFFCFKLVLFFLFSKKSLKLIKLLKLLTLVYFIDETDNSM